MPLCRVNIALAAAGCAALALFSPATALAGFPAENVSLYSHLTLADLNAEFAEDCWGYVSPSGREYAIIGLSQGPGFVEITDPANPVIVDIVNTPNRARDMKVFGHYVYTSSDSGPLNVIDVSDIDNGNITLVDSFPKGATHNVVIDEVSGFLYLAIGGPLVALDLANPELPTFAGIWDGQAHDAQVVTYTEGKYAGRQIAFVFAGWDGRLDIVDVTDKSNMFLVGQTSYPSPGYTHQGWLTADRQYLYVSDEVDDIPRTTIINVSDLSNPTFISDFTNGLDSTDHNLYVRDGFIFETNYTSGLRVFNACDPVNPIEVGFFDTFPANNDPGFSGAWSNYPFFPSGTVIVSDRSGGLFVLDVSQATAGGCGGCEADFDGDNVVGVKDLLFLLGVWGPCPKKGDCAADFDGDNVVGVKDLLFLLGAWGPCP
ncbi:MAG: choice-of-anchor B family protein [Planctomycetes bacterium]|nr:choice-of-anchor B family protein [Planctomycetota bacterium]